MEGDFTWGWLWAEFLSFLASLFDELNEFLQILLRAKYVII
jgi:hypothetical protein